MDTRRAVHSRLIAGLQACALLAGCGGGGGMSPPPADSSAPTVPAGLSATVAGPAAVDLAWSASTDTGGSGLAGYRIVRDGAVMASVGSSATSYRDTSVAAATRYSYTVRAFDAASPPNVSADSAPAIATTPPGSQAGLDARPVNLSCIAPPRPTQPTSIALTRAFANLTFASPVGAYQPPGDSSRWLVLEQGGRLRSFSNTSNASTTTTFLDISARVAFSGELGLLGFAFHPNWPATPQAFLYYSRAGTSPVENVIARFTSSDGGVTLDPASEQLVLRLVKNQPDTNHNGGNLAFGPDGYLYIGTGDGGSGGDPKGNAQNLNVLFGKLLRIDVGTGGTYTIPADNPYAANPKCSGGSGTAQCPEVWAYGLRNPWRFSFDAATGALWVGDVGQNAREEVDVITRGGNYGWNVREGSACYNATSCATATAGGVPYVPPVTDYDHGIGQSITGGFVYRGARIAALAGQYLFGDYVSGRVFAHSPGAPNLARTELLATGLNISSFARGNDGELFIVSYGSGELYAIGPGSGTASNAIPDQLSASGCVDPTDATLPYAGLIPYAPNAAFWSDGAAKSRYVALPPAATVTPLADGDFDLPNGTVLVKHFRLGNRLIETRLFMRHPDGVWAGYSYEWNDAQTDATRVVGGKSRAFGSQTWIYPSEDQCLQCHTQAAGRSLGLETAQLNGTFTYPTTARTANQLDTWNAIGVLAPQVTGTRPALPDPYGAAGTVGERARAYLHANCSQCHRPGGPTPSTLDLRFDTPLAATNACNVAPSAGTLGIANAQIIAAGDPDRSVIVSRVSRRDPFAMPPVASAVTDAAGIALLRSWIQGLASCQ